MIKTYSKEIKGVSPGNAGANQVWDFSDIIFEGEPSVIKVIYPSSTAFSSYFPTGTLAETSDDQSYVISHITSTERIRLGSFSNHSMNTTTVVYSNPMTIVKLPLKYNESFSDDFNGTYVESDIIKSGSITTTYDGYGTLKTQFGTYDNIIRLKYTTIEKETSQV
ncbi:hypothetical protein CIN01S_18_01010 [Sporocytophaga myxococcoides]|uniref:Uncharacterized protein n=1 Tax=Sporocytophaga myxococcoides TaxID=153721 RepID=A0A098L9J4_9BACT|nr:hypothetical protein [Sporocytophaga myxococcoides]GAL83626.1 hypothetical protein CIN01S_18_01010 [Sporocytophaga myxococcoides]